MVKIVGVKDCNWCIVWWSARVGHDGVLWWLEMVSSGWSGRKEAQVSVWFLLVWFSDL